MIGSPSELAHPRVFIPNPSAFALAPHFPRAHQFVPCLIWAALASGLFNGPREKPLRRLLPFRVALLCLVCLPSLRPVSSAAGNFSGAAMFSLSLSLSGSAGPCRVPADVTCAGCDALLGSRPRLRGFAVHGSNLGSSFSLQSHFANRSLISGFDGKSSPKSVISCIRAPLSPGNPGENYQLWKNSIRTLAVTIVGSLLFFGRFGCKPALSVADAPTEENLVSQSDEAGEEDELTARLLETNPKDVETLKMVFYEKMKKGKTRKAVDYVDMLIDAEPDEVEWKLLKALCYELMGRLSKAKQLFKGILEERPLQLRALHGLALVMHKNREGPAVFEMLRKALELARNEQRVTEERNIRILIAQMHVVKGDLEGGLARFQKLAEENPTDFRPYLCQGIIYSLLERKEEAEEQFEIYRSLVPEEFPQRSFLDDVVLSAKAEPTGLQEPSK